MPDRLKEALRLTHRLIRENLPLSYQQTISNLVCARIRKLDQYRYASRIALYQAVKGEIKLDSLWNSAPLQGKYCFFPALNENKTLSFLPATPKTPFKPNQFNIPEPDVSRDLALEPSKIDIIFMPLIAFDRHGTRLGMGAGYYDRTMANKKLPLLIGVAYEFQRVSYIAPQPWDIPLAGIVTEKSVYWSNS